MANKEITSREFMCKYVESEADDKIKAYLLRNVMFDSGYVVSSIANICREVGISKRKALFSFKVLRKDGFIKKRQAGVWIVNPKLLHNPNSKAYKEIMKEFVKTVDDIKEELA